MSLKEVIMIMDFLSIYSRKLYSGLELMVLIVSVIELRIIILEAGFWETSLVLGFR